LCEKKAEHNMWNALQHISSHVACPDMKMSIKGLYDKISLDFKKLDEVVSKAYAEKKIVKGRHSSKRQ